MNPDIEIRLKSVVKALEQVVLPAIPPDNSLAREQITVAIGHIELLRSQWNYVDRYADLCLSDITAFAKELIASLGDDPESSDIASSLALAVQRAQQSQTSSASEVWSLRNCIASAIDEAIVAVTLGTSESARNVVDVVTLRHCAKEHARDRSWFAKTGFDPEASSLPSIAELFVQDLRQR
jgi:hypothetical protein